MELILTQYGTETESKVLVQLTGSDSVVDHHEPVPAGGDLVTGLTGESLDGIIAAEVLVAILSSGVLGPVRRSHWVHGSRDEGGHWSRSARR